MADFIRLDAKDNVVSAIKTLEVGAEIESTATKNLIPRGHKIATRAIAEGEAIYKYAQLIGYAAENIEPGSHVHTHNVEFRNVEASYEFSTDLREA